MAMLGKRSFDCVDTGHLVVGDGDCDSEGEKNWKNSGAKNLLISRNLEGMKISSLELDQDNTNRLSNFYNQINKLIYKVSTTVLIP